MLPINGLARLSFDSHVDYRAFADKNAALLTQIWLWHETLGNRPESFELPGVCDLCECQTTFGATPRCTPDRRFRFSVDWWSGAKCKCSMSNLDRAVLRVFFERHQPQDHVYHVGQYSYFRRWLSERIPNLTSSQYEAGRKPGEVAQGVRYEDLTRLSFEGGQFSSIICMEVLEHIPDYTAALREMARVLLPGGRSLLSFPWLGRDTYDHLIRAELKADGSIQHLKSPEFHRDPANPEGILSFRSFGWRILDELRDAGFSNASAEFVFNPVHGYMTLLNPVVVGIR